MTGKWKVIKKLGSEGIMGFIDKYIDIATFVCDIITLGVVICMSVSK